jgi:hypothetical protein
LGSVELTVGSPTRAVNVSPATSEENLYPVGLQPLWVTDPKAFNALSFEERTLIFSLFCDSILDAEMKANVPTDGLMQL